MLIDEDDLGLVGRDVDHLDRGGLVCDRDREGVVDKDTDDDTVFETDEERFFLGWTRYDLDVRDGALKDPLAYEDARKGQQLDLLLEDEDQVLRRHE